LNYYRAEATDDPEKASQILKAALDYYQQAISLNPIIETERLKEYVIGAHLSLANAYLETGQIEKAIEEIQVASDLAPAERKAELEAYIAQLKGQEQ
jgi:tetratricopeptide (TPR) repeat protein